MYIRIYKYVYVYINMNMYLYISHVHKVIHKCMYIYTHICMTLSTCAFYMCDMTPSYEGVVYIYTYV